MNCRSPLSTGLVSEAEERGWAWEKRDPVQGGLYLKASRTSSHLLFEPVTHTCSFRFEVGTFP